MLKRDIDLFVINWYSLTSQKMIFFQGGKIFIVKIVYGFLTIDINHWSSGFLLNFD